MGVPGLDSQTREVRCVNGAGLRTPLRGTLSPEVCSLIRENAQNSIMEAKRTRTCAVSGMSRVQNVRHVPGPYPEHPPLPPLCSSTCRLKQKI